MNRSFEDYKNLIDSHLADYMPPVDSKSMLLYESMEYSLMAGGKRLRPVLALAACDMAGGDIKEALPYACAVEYIHTYSLIHDDLPAMDNDDLRRGRPTNHKVYGDAIAILAGDGLLSIAFEVMYRDCFMYFDNQENIKKRINAAYAIARSAGCRGMVAGQVADIEAEKKKCSDEMLEYIHANKCGALIVGAVKAGMYMGNANDKMLKDFSEFAECFGLAYQVQDDILDFLGDTELLGKPAYSDEKSNKSTYVTMFGIDAATNKFEELTKKALYHLEDYGDDAKFFVDLVNELKNRQK